jgi:hypothetical protein
MAKRKTTRQTGKGTGAAGKAAARGAGTGGRWTRVTVVSSRDSSNPKHRPKNSDSILAPLASGDNPSPTNANFFSHIRRVLDAVRYPFGSDPPSDDDLDRILGRIDRPQPQPEPLPVIRTPRDAVAALRRLADSLECGALFLQCANAGNIAGMCGAGASGGSVLVSELMREFPGIELSVGLDERNLSGEARTGDPNWWFRISVFPNDCLTLAKRTRDWIGIHDAVHHAPFMQDVYDRMAWVLGMVDGLLPGANSRPWLEADRAEGRQAKALHAAAIWCREMAELYAPTKQRAGRKAEDFSAIMEFICSRRFLLRQGSDERALAKQIADDWRRIKPKDCKQIGYSRIERLLASCSVVWEGQWAKCEAAKAPQK